LSVEHRLAQAPLHYYSGSREQRSRRRLRGDSSACPSITTFYTNVAQRAFPDTHMNSDEYLELGRHIWQTYVPRTGQSSTVQGELLRANEKLRDEAHRNGNVNWDEGHEILARYIGDTLEAWVDLAPDRKVQLRADITLLTVPDTPYLEDDAFDRVERCILDWCAAHPEPVPHTHNPELRR